VDKQIGVGNSKYVFASDPYF